MHGQHRFGTYLLNFLLWSALLGFLHYAFLPTYIQLLFLLSDAALEPITGKIIELGVVKNDGIFASKGFILQTPDMAQGREFRYPHNLYSVTLNFMFAPALVLATLGTTGSAWVRAILAALIMLLLHALHLVTIALYFPLTQAPIPNPLINADFPAWLAAFVRWNYTFTDKMGYTLFPFIAWFCVCFATVIALFQRYGAAPSADGSSGTKENGAEKRT